MSTITERIRKTAMGILGETPGEWVDLKEVVSAHFDGEVNKLNTNKVKRALDPGKNKQFKYREFNMVPQVQIGHGADPTGPLTRARALWMMPVTTWWDETCGSTENVFDKLSPLPDPRDQERHGPPEIQCAWTCIWEGGKLPAPSDELWFLREADEDPLKLFYELKDYVTLPIPGLSRNAIQYVFQGQNGNLTAFESGSASADIALGRARRPRYSASWDLQRVPGPFGPAFNAKFRPEWGPCLEERFLIGKYSPEKVATWGFMILRRLYDEYQKSNSRILDLAKNHPIEDLLLMKETKVVRLHQEMREQMLIGARPVA